MNRLSNPTKYGVLFVLIVLAIWVVRVELQSMLITIQDLPPPTLPAHDHPEHEVEPTIRATTTPQLSPMPQATSLPAIATEPSATATQIPAATPPNTPAPATLEAFAKTVVVQMEIQREREYLAQMQDYYAKFHAVTDQAAVLQTNPEKAFDETWNSQLRIYDEEIGQSMAALARATPPARFVNLRRLILQQGDNLHQGIHALDPTVTQNHASGYSQAKRYFERASQFTERAKGELKKLESTW